MRKGEGYGREEEDGREVELSAEKVLEWSAEKVPKRREPPLVVVVLLAALGREGEKGNATEEEVEAAEEAEVAVATVAAAAGAFLVVAWSTFLAAVARLKRAPLPAEPPLVCRNLATSLQESNHKGRGSGGLRDARG